MKKLAFVQGRVVGVLALITAPALVACSSGRDVTIEGEVVAPASLTQSGAIKVEFIDVLTESERETVHDIELEGPGAFDATMALEGDKVLIRAILDADGDGACSTGEAWAEAEADIAEDDTVEPVSLTLAVADCPSES